MNIGLGIGVLFLKTWERLPNGKDGHFSDIKGITPTWKTWTWGILMYNPGAPQDLDKVLDYYDKIKYGVYKPGPEDPFRR